MKSKVLYNPFNQVAGFLSLILGLFGLSVVTWLAFITGTHFNGLTHIAFARDSEYWVFLTESLSNWFFIAAFMHLSGLILSKSRIRAIDVWGTTLLSRLPLVITPMIRTLPVFQSFLIQSWQRYFLHGVYLTSLIWFLILLFHAFKISCNLKNDKLVASFIISMVLAEICTTIFLKSII